MPQYLNEGDEDRGIRGTPQVREGSSTGINTDLSQLILRPEYASKVSITLAAVSKELEASSRKRSWSSAYRAIFSSIDPLLKRLIPGWERIKAARGSIISANSCGDIGHPCLVPLLRENVCEVKLLMRRRALGEV